MSKKLSVQTSTSIMDSISSATSSSKPGANSVQYQSIGSEGSTPSYKSVQYRLYPWRWFMLASLCILNISNGMMWLTFAPIPNFTASYYNVPVSSVDWFSMSFFVASLFMGFVSIYVLNRFGLKVSVYLGAIFNVVGALVRILSTIEPVICSPVFSQAGFAMAMLGQILTAFSQPYLLYTPTTLACVWFGPKERAVATGLSSLANPVGLAIVQVASPYIVTAVSKLPMLLWIYAIPAVLSFLMTMVAFWYNAPPIPPSSSSSRDNVLSFFQGLKKILTTPSFLVLLVVWGCASGLFNALLTILPQILCPYGYSDKDSGLWGSLMIFSGMVGATIGGVILDYSKRFKEVTVVAYSLAIISFIWFYEVFTLTGQGINIAFSLCVFGFFGLVLIPACMELGVEVTYPAAEVTSSGLLWSAAQVVGIVIVLVGEMIQVPLSDELIKINQCLGPSVTNDSSIPSCFRPSHNSSIPSVIRQSTELTDSSNTIIFCLVLTVLNFMFFVLCFCPKYKRMDSENKASFEKSLYN